MYSFNLFLDSVMRCNFRIDNSVLRVLSHMIHIWFLCCFCFLLVSFFSSFIRRYYHALNATLYIWIKIKVLYLFMCILVRIKESTVRFSGPQHPWGSIRVYGTDRILVNSFFRLILQKYYLRNWSNNRLNPRSRRLIWIPRMGDF